MSSRTVLYRRVEPRANLQWAFAGGGAIVTAVSLVLDPAQGWAGLLGAALFGLTLALGGALFLAIQAASGASWWWPLRVVPITLARTLAAPVVPLVLCLTAGMGVLYPWSRPEVVAASHLLSSKVVWLNPPFFLARALIVLVLWFVLIGALGSRLRALAATLSPQDARGLSRVAIVFLVLFAITVSVAAWDWGMSLEPEWFSTMYGVYLFAGTMLGGIAATTVLALLLDRKGMLPARLSDEVVHDLGKLVFAFATFWAYIWFCQYLLVWYANLPEETGHYAARLAGPWSSLFWLNPLLNWVPPFVVLLSAEAKKRRGTLLQVAALVLVGRWVDVYLLVAPSLGFAPAFPFAALFATAAVLAGMGTLWRRALPGETRRMSIRS